MKKTLSILLLSGLLVSFALPLVVSAQSVEGTKMLESCTLRHTISVGGTTHYKGETLSYDEGGMFCVMDAVYTATDWIFAIILAIAIIFILFGGFTIVTAGGNAEKAIKGKNYIVYALVGFVIALLAKLIPAVAKYFIGG